MEFIRRGDVTDGTVQTRDIVVPDEVGDDALCIGQAQRRFGTNTLPLDGLIPALQLAVALRVERRGANLVHTLELQELLEVPGSESRPFRQRATW